MTSLEAMTNVDKVTKHPCTLDIGLLKPYGGGEWPQFNVHLD